MFPVNVALKVVSNVRVAAAACVSLGCTNTPSRLGWLFRSSTDWLDAEPLPPVPLVPLDLLPLHATDASSNPAKASLVIGPPIQGCGSGHVT
jgi:hypothetical protein